MARKKYPKNEEAPEAPKSLEGDELILKDSRDGLRAQINEEHDERALMLDDLRFSTLDQWPTNLRAERESDVNGARPCLTIDKVNQYVTQVVNDLRQNKPAVQVRPVDDKSDPETAKIFQGLVRHIEDRSNAHVAYETAGESAIRIGLGFFRITTDYVSHDSFDQEILIKRIPNTFSVYLGPHLNPDGSDAEKGWIFERMPKEKFEREFPGKKAKAESFDGLAPEALSFWLDDQGIVVCEYFYTHYEKQELLFLSDGTTTTRKEYDASERDAEPEQQPDGGVEAVMEVTDVPVGMPPMGMMTFQPPRPTITDTRQTHTKSIKWCKHTGTEILEKRDWAGKYIPIVEVVGKEAHVDGKRRLWGLTRPAKDALRAYNYWISALTEKMALAPKAPWVAAVGQWKGREDEWMNSNRETKAGLQYLPIEVGGNVVPAPKRQDPVQMEPAMMQMLVMMEGNVKSALGMFKASVGDSESQQSGRAILALTRESDTGTYHFGANTALSVQHCGRIIVDLAPKIMDTRRIARIIGEDGKTDTVTLDPEQKQSVRRIQDSGGAIRKVYNLDVGTYDVTVTVGPSYNTKRMEAAAVFTELSKGAADPMSAAVMRYLTVKNSDFTASKEASDMLFALLPPQAQAVNQPDGDQQIPPQAMQKIAQLTQVAQAMQQKGQELAQENQQLKSGAQVQVLKVEADAKAKADALEVEKVVQAEKQRLAREQFEFEKALEFEKLNHEIDLAERKAGAEHNRKRDELTFQQECHAEESAVNLADKQKSEAESSMPQFVQTISTIAQAVVASVQNQSELNAAMVKAIAAPRVAELQFKDGKAVGAVSKTLQ